MTFSIMFWVSFAICLLASVYCFFHDDVSISDTTILTMLTFVPIINSITAIILILTVIYKSLREGLTRLYRAYQRAKTKKRKHKLDTTPRFYKGYRGEE